MLKRSIFIALNLLMMTSVFAAQNPLYQSATTTRSTTTTSGGSGGGGGDLSAATGILNAIKKDTGDILKAVNDIPKNIQTLLTEFLDFKKNMTQTQEADKKPPALIYNTQTYMDSLGQFFQYGIPRDPNFADSTNDNIDNMNNRILRLQKLGFAQSQTVNNVQYDESSFKPDPKTGVAAISNALPTINQVTYTNVIGLPPIIANVKKDDAMVEAYIQAASGSGLLHDRIPKFSPNMTSNQKSYFNYFNLSYAIQSFNNYVMSKYLLNSDQLNQQQSALYRKASNSTYLSSIASEPIGHVLRDILLFQSQNYVISSKLLEVQKELLMANVMTNSLLIANNSQNESVLYDKVQTG